MGSGEGEIWEWFCQKCSRTSCRQIDGHHGHQPVRHVLNMLSLAFPAHFVETELFEHISVKVTCVCQVFIFRNSQTLSWIILHVFNVCPSDSFPT